MGVLNTLLKISSFQAKQTSSIVVIKKLKFKNRASFSDVGQFMEVIFAFMALKKFKVQFFLFNFALNYYMLTRDHLMTNQNALSPLPTRLFK